MTNKEFKQSLKENANPGIRTLDEALALSSAYTGDDERLRREADRRAVSAVLNRISTQIDTQADYATLTYGERLVDTIGRILDGEVMNGGFNQYLCNSSGDTAEDAKRYLRDVGAKHTLELLTRVASVFPDGVVPTDSVERCDLIDQYEDSHPEADLGRTENREYYLDRENLHGLLIEYVRSHRQEFALPADDVVRRSRQFADVRHYYAQRKRNG